MDVQAIICTVTNLSVAPFLSSNFAFPADDAVHAISMSIPVVYLSPPSGRVTFRSSARLDHGGEKALALETKIAHGANRRGRRTEEISIFQRDYRSTGLQLSGVPPLCTTRETGTSTGAGLA